MKKLLLVILLIIGMALSFAAIALVMLFASGAVESIDEVRTLVTGDIVLADSSLLGGDEVGRLQDALILLQQQKETMVQDLKALDQIKQARELQAQTLADSLAALNEAGQTAGSNQGQRKKEQLAQAIALYNGMKPANAALIMNEMSDEMILEILPNLKERSRAKILSALNDDKRKARLTAKLMGRKVPGS